MFQTYRGPFAAISVSLCLTIMPATSYAEGKIAPVEQTQIELSSAAAQTSSLKDMSFNELRRDAKTNLSKTKRWVKHNKIERNVKYFVDDVEKATNRFQKQVSPAGRSLKSFFGHKMPGKNLAQQGDRAVTAYGLILVMAFVFVLFIMGLASPASRLGGRH